jgi:hypothetical protein
MFNFTPGGEPVSIELEARLAPQPSWTLLKKRGFLAADRIRTPDRPYSSESLHRICERVHQFVLGKTTESHLTTKGTIFTHLRLTRSEKAKINFIAYIFLLLMSKVKDTEMDWSCSSAI